ncbi:MAG: PAS domain S-box protein [bacterium]|nr:PAS domain S-box protein [bacterium]
MSITINGMNIKNERLIHKLEERLSQLEKEVKEHRQAEEELKKYRDHLAELVDESTAELTQINHQLEQEISERKQIENALRQSEEKYKAQYKGIPIPTYTWQWNGDDFVLINCNNAADTVTDGRIPGFAGKTAKQMYGNNPEILNDFQQCYTSRGPLQREMSYRYKTTGALRHLIVTYAFIPPDLIVVHTEDITKRKQAEEVLKKAHHQLEIQVTDRTRELTETNLRLLQEKEKARRYLDIAEVMIVVLNTDRTVALINRKGCEILGYPCEEIIGKNWFDCFLPQNLRTPVKEVFAKLMAGQLESVKYYENPVLTKIGEERLIAWHNTLIKDEEGKVVSTLASGEDITQRKHTEEMMIQSEKMVTAGRLAAGMAHEINNPLAGILQSIQVIQGRVSPKSPANREAAEKCGITIEAVEAYLYRRKIPGFLAAVKEAGERAAVIVENMLSFSRKSESSFALNDIGELLDKTIVLAENEYDLSKKYDFRQIAIVKEYQPNIAPVPCEASKIQQVIFNLLKNAAQAIYERKPASKPKEPRITLRTKREKDMVRIDVKDNGPGIPGDVRRKIFEPFFTTKSVGTGTGLGLSVSYFIITENHRGTMEVISTPGRGTTFTIRLPLAEEEIK